jgi:hypothetical protein
MSSAPGRQGASHHEDARANEIEVLADDFVTFVEEFELALSEGRVPLAFVERLSQFIQTAERLI